ncbi:hypothetical protein [Ornithinimicrobium sediminis]|uniref:hypothetical protein n=1 Tax=Ornithinimicrobium sediminis TaxID=2904603 RepID=UPI001E39D468|nr:hypothetical protein [Ornithinimicrobium sediminis]MCE0485980.1 hypothetical protein [Ornithinimicrobium sediminis]
MSKIMLAAAAAAGYVFGTRAGRERYDQLSEKAQGLWQKPSVQRAAEKAGLASHDTAQSDETHHDTTEQQDFGTDPLSGSESEFTHDRPAEGEWRG